MILANNRFGTISYGLLQQLDRFTYDVVCWLSVTTSCYTTFI